MQITKIKTLKKTGKLTCMTPGCITPSDYRVNILEDGMRLNVIVCHKCYIEGRCLDFLYPADEKTSQHPSLNSF